MTRSPGAVPAALTGGAAAGLALVAAPGPLGALQAGSEIFSVDVGLIVWTWILFLLTLGVLAKWVFPMIAGGLEERRQKIQVAIDQARAEREEARRLLEERKQELEEASREVRDLIEEGRKAGERLRKEILEEAREEQGKMMARARREMDRERKKLRQEVRREAVEVSIAAAERLLRTRMDSEENRELVRDYVSEIQ